MKKATLLAFLFALVATLAAQTTSNLVLFNEANQPFTVLLNGQRVNDRTAKNIKITGLLGGSYTVKIVYPNPSWGTFTSTLYVEPGHEVTYACRKDAQSGHYFLFVSEFALDYAPIMPEPQIEFTFHDVPPPPPIPTEVVNPNPTPNPTPVPTDVIVVVPVETTTVITTTTTTTNTPPPPPPVAVPGYTGPIGCPWPVTAQEMDQVKASIKSKTFEDTKMTMAKQALSGKCILSDDVVAVMNLFTFESSKLDFAKWAWDITYDRGNYFKVNDGFTYSSSISELDRYLAGKR